MDRSIIYTQEQPRTFDVLWAWRDTLFALAYLEQDLAGATTAVVSGVVATASSPASLVLHLSAGRIYEQAPIDATQYGSIPADTDLVMQQGYAAAQAVTLTTSGLSSGQSRWALIEVAFSQVDVVRANDPTGGLLYYWNSDNPTVPFQGPGGNGQVQDTERQGVATIQVIYGSVATSGAEVPPSPSAGYVPLYLVDLAFGQTTVVQGQIIVAGPSVGANVPGNYPYAPFLAGLLNSHHNGTPGQAPKIKMIELANVSSAAAGSGISAGYSYAGNPNGHVAGVAAVVGVSPTDLCIDTTNNLLYFCSTTGNAAGAVWNPTTGQQVNFSGGLSTGTANAQVVTPLTPGGFALTSGYSVTFTPGVTNTTATTLAAGGTAATACRKVSGASLVAFTGGEFTINIPVTVVFNGTFWVLQTGTLGALAALNIGAFLKNDGSGNLAVNNGLGLASDGTGALTVAAAGVLPAMLSAAGAPLPRVGVQTADNLQLSNDVTNPTFAVALSVGRVRDDSDVVNLLLGAATIKRLDQSWAPGTGNGGCDTSTKGASQTWHAYLIGKPGMAVTNYQRTSNVASLTIAGHNQGVGGTLLVYGLGGGFDGLQTITAVTTNTLNYSNAGSNVGSSAAPATALADGIDLLFSQSYPTPAFPSGWTVKQCLGSVQTDGSANILPFVQIGDLFLLKSPNQATAGATLDATPRNFTVAVPNGRQVEALFSGWANIASNTQGAYFYCPSLTDTAVVAGTGPMTMGIAVNTGSPTGGAVPTQYVMTNTARQIRGVASASGNCWLQTQGYRDPCRRLF